MKILPTVVVLMESLQLRANLTQDVQVSHVYHYFRPKLIKTALCQPDLFSLNRFAYKIGNGPLSNSKMINLKHGILDFKRVFWYSKDLCLKGARTKHGHRSLQFLFGCRVHSVTFGHRVHGVTFGHRVLI